MLDVCRRMSLRGWVEWYEERGSRRARLTPAGREALEAADALHKAIAEMNAARRLGPLQRPPAFLVDPSRTGGERMCPLALALLQSLGHDPKQGIVVVDDLR
jgi:DNA-binding transcriptional LysR family regulator